MFSRKIVQKPDPAIVHDHLRTKIKMNLNIPIQEKNQKYRYKLIKYNTPCCNDMAVLLVYFNFVKSNRILQNLYTVKSMLDSAEIPYFIAELAFNDEPHVFKKQDNIFHFRTSSYMFYKENLIFCAEKLIPDTYSKICLIDSDIVFDNPQWYDIISNKLDEFSIIQPFNKAHWLNFDYTIQMVKSNVVDDNTNTEINYSLEHPGFAWAFTRPAFNELNFFDKSVVSSAGDAILTYMVTNKSGVDSIKVYEDFYREKIQPASHDYECSSCELNIYHLYHGLLGNRQYVSIHNVVYNHLNRMQKTLSDIIERREDNLLEWKPKYRKDMNTMMLNYFTLRKDDE
jgi:hypothetical protein